MILTNSTRACRCDSTQLIAVPSLPEPLPLYAPIPYARRGMLSIVLKKAACRALTDYSRQGFPFQRKKKREGFIATFYIR